MPAMMLPSLVVWLWRHRRALGALAVPVGAAYLMVWCTLGIAVFPLAIAFGEAQLRWPALARGAPLLAAVTVIVAGFLQFTEWKQHQLACCREAAQRRALPSDIAGAWGFGFRFGLRCVACCAGFTASLLAIGMMDLRAMAIVTAAITLERLAPSRRAAARAVGVVGLAAGVWLAVQ